MQTIKERTLDFIKSLPDECTLDDIMEALWVQRKILVGQQQIKDGHFLSHEEAKKRFEKWLK